MHSPSHLLRPLFHLTLQVAFTVSPRQQRQQDITHQPARNNLDPMQHIVRLKHNPPPPRFLTTHPPPHELLHKTRGHHPTHKFHMILYKHRTCGTTGKFSDSTFPDTFKPRHIAPTTTQQAYPLPVPPLLPSYDMDGHPTGFDMQHKDTIFTLRRNVLQTYQRSRVHHGTSCHVTQQAY